MATLHVRNVSDDLYARLQAMAKEHDCSLSTEVIHLLEQEVKRQALRLEQELKHQAMRAQQGNILADIRRHRFTPPADMPDSTALLREDRER